jgi:hypothetical protein
VLNIKIENKMGHYFIIQIYLMNWLISIYNYIVGNTHSKTEDEHYNKKMDCLEKGTS